MMKKTVLFLLGLFVVHGSYAEKVVIFDLGGVLTHAAAWRSIKYAYKNVGVRGFVRYMFDGHNPFRIKKQVFRLLDDFDAYRGACGKNTVACYGSSLMPQVICDWLAGDYLGKDVIHDVLEWIDITKRCSYSERQMFKHILFAAFDPQTRGSLISGISAGIDIVLWCKEQGCRVMILSNIDQETFELLYSKPDLKILFEQFDPQDIFISAAMKKIKPHKDIFEKLIQERKLSPSACIFVDDQPENVDTANKVGMHGVLCVSHRKVKDQLQELILVPQK